MNYFKVPKSKKSWKNYFLLQHFKGWVIETPNAQFNPSVATLMDFTVSQKEGTTFMYTMPTSTTTALVEYTLFTKNLLQTSEYENALKKSAEEYEKFQIFQKELEKEQSMKELEEDLKKMIKK